MPEEIKPSQQERTMAALSYIWILSIVVLLTQKKKFVHDHAKQGLLLFVGECIVFIPIIGWLLGWIVSLIAIVLALVGIIKAWNGEEWKVPLIGEWWDRKIKI
jgi:uncharacterized membrane protein